MNRAQTESPDVDPAAPVDSAVTAATVDMLARFRDGDPDAFAAIVGEFEGRLVQFFYRLCWDRDRAEDFTQDLFLKLLRGARRYKPQGRLATFIFRVATNLWIDNYRSNKPKGKVYSLDKVLLTGEPVIKTDRVAEAPGDRMILGEEREQLRYALTSLSEPHRLVLELAVYQEMPYAQISTVLSIPVGTVKSRMHNSVRALRVAMTDQRGSFADGGRSERGGGAPPTRFPRQAGGLAG